MSERKWPDGPWTLTSSGKPWAYHVQQVPSHGWFLEISMGYPKEEMAYPEEAQAEFEAIALLARAAPDLYEALGECQRLLADLARPDAKACPLEIANTWARCVATEAKARAALARSTGQEM